uniref:Uncharacterized protein n=1 Tax=Cannabis sativa TaxID=3483 RepID=A0A803PHX3_CANSA
MDSITQTLFQNLFLTEKESIIHELVDDNPIIDHGSSYQTSSEVQGQNNSGAKWFAFTRLSILVGDVVRKMVKRARVGSTSTDKNPLVQAGLVEQPCLEKNNPMFLFVMESKFLSGSCDKLRVKLSFDHVFEVPKKGFRGGLLLFWKQEVNVLRKGQTFTLVRPCVWKHPHRMVSGCFRMSLQFSNLDYPVSVSGYVLMDLSSYRQDSLSQTEALRPYRTWMGPSWLFWALKIHISLIQKLE